MTTPFYLKDNDYTGIECSDSVRNAVAPIAGITLRELSEKNPDLLIFPKSLGDNDDGIDDQTLITLNGGKIQTGNVLGFFGINDIRFLSDPALMNRTSNSFCRICCKKFLELTC